MDMNIDMDQSGDGGTDFTEIGRGVYRRKGAAKLATTGTAGGYRTWDPHHSKLAALILTGYLPPIEDTSLVLYLGAAAGSTASHVSDIAHRGLVYALDFAPGEMKKLILACEERSNMIPIFADANHPERYAHLVDEVDIIYQDIAQRNQAEIALRNVECFLTDGGYLILMIKARSIDSTADTRATFGKEVAELREGISVLKTVKLPQYRDHLAVIARR